MAAQGLLVPPTKAPSRAGLRSTIARMALLQIDTIHVVARSPYLVLFSRLGAYPRAWLEETLAAGHVFEIWAHEACFAPADDLLLHRAYNRSARTHWGLAHAQRTHAQQRAHLDKLLAHIRDNGAVKSSDFERTQGQGGAWWGWKDEKRWLEALFASGELMVARRENFHRVYDISERVAPLALAREAEAPALDAQPVHDQFIEMSMKALGVTQARWINDYFRLKPRLKDADLDALVDSGQVLRVGVEGWDSPAYVHACHTALLRKATKGLLAPRLTTLLSPFDPVVWDRERGSAFFDFDYRLECYTPEAKRVHGYFVLPILCQGELIGRLDAKAHRAEGIFEVKTLHAEAGSAWSAEQVQAVAQAIVDCAAWHDTPTVRITATRPAGLKAALVRTIKAVSAAETRKA